MIPKYKLVYESMKDKIVRDIYHPSDQIPDGDTLASEYDCSKLTVKKALDMLVHDGYLVRKRGLGSFVKKVIPKNIPQNEYYATSRPLIREGFSAIVEKFEIEKCSEEIARHLCIQTGDFVYSIIRVRLYKDKPIVVEYTWMPVSLIRGLELKHLTGSLYHYIVKELNYHIQSAHISVTATRPNDIEKKYFQMDEHDFVNKVCEVGFLDTSQIFEYTISHHIPEFFEFETTIMKNLYE